MQLFDAGVRSRLEPASRSESHFRYLNTSARPGFRTSRQTLEEWFARFPAQGKRELRTRFRSDDSFTHLSAFFELLLHESMMRLDCDVELHPSVAGVSTRPDFRGVPRDGGEPFYLEATIATDLSEVDRGEARREAAAFDEINKLDCLGFSLHVEVGAVGPHAISGGVLRRFLRGKLATVDGRTLPSNPFDGPEWDLTEAGWHLRFQPIARPSDAPRRPGAGVIGISGTMEVYRVSSHEPIRRAVRRKAGKYGATLNHPYLIAVLDASHHAADAEDAMAALFGDARYRFDPQDVTKPHQLMRGNNGAWLTDRPVYTRNSGMLLFTDLLPWSIHEATVMLFHNPHARRPYASCFTRFPQAVPDSARGALTPLPGVALGDVLGLPPDWPGHEQGDRRRGVSDTA